MHIRKACRRIAAYILSILLALSASVAVPALQVHASRAAVADSLLGSGASDELNIIKILDMALNKAGMSMSPSKIREFLQYWWLSVSSDLQTLVNDAGTTVTTVSDFVDYVASAAADPTKADGLEMAQLTLRFARFCATQEIKTLADYKNLITQEGMFRKFLLSYVTDSEGKVTESIGNNKLAKYNLKSDFINMVRQAADCYIEEYEGYYLVATHKVGDINPLWFSSREMYDALVDSVQHNLDLGIYGYGYEFSHFYCVDLNGWNFVYSHSDGSIESFRSGSMLGLIAYDKNWNAWYNGNRPVYVPSDESIKIYMDGDTTTKKAYYGFFKYMYTEFKTVSNIASYNCPQIMIFTENGDMIKVWKSLDSLKSYSVGKSSIYYTSNYSSYDSSVDNSIEFTGSYYSNSSTNYSHEIIQNTIDNSQEVIDESTINNITNQTVYNITNNYYADSSGDDDPDDKPGGWWNIGEGISAFIEGVASLLDFILKLLGDLVGLLGTFLTSVLDVLSSLTALGQGFGDFLGATFTFLPEECVSLIVSSIAAMCVVGVVKAIIK